MELFYTGILAGMALLFKVAILMQVVTLSNVTRAFNLVTIGFICQHAFEFLGLMTYQTQPAIASYMVNGVLISAYFLCASFLHLALTINPLPYAREVRLAGWIAFVAVCITHGSGEVVAGIVRTGYSLITEPGAQYPVAIAFIVYSTLIVITILAHGFIKGSSTVSKLSGYTAASMLPVAIAACSVIALRMAGFQSSSAMVLPLASTYFVWKMMQFELGTIAPFTLRWSVFWYQIRQALSVLLWKKDYSITQQYADLERHQIETAMPLCEYNVAAASRLLNMSWSNVDRKCKQYGITEAASPAKAAQDLQQSGT